MSPSSPLSATSAKLIDAGDLNELTSHVNGLVLDQDWEQLGALRSACRQAFERGKQLWPVASYIEYRLCLQGPGRWAAAMLESGGGRFALGPLPEVAATRHTWAELAPHLQSTPEAALAAHERVVRGEDLSRGTSALALPEVLDLPLRLQDWEPRYAVPVYREASIEAPPPRLPPLAPFTAMAVGSAEAPLVPPASPGWPPAGAPEADSVCRVLEELVTAWTSESNGRAQTAWADGPALDAVGALGARPHLAAELAPTEALAAMAWAASDGGAHGRRRGAAPGRHGAWLVLACLGGLEDEWPLPAGKLGDVARRAHWYHWSSGEPESGWSLRLALELSLAPPGPTARARSWALSAQDDD